MLSQQGPKHHLKTQGKVKGQEATIAWYTMVHGELACLLSSSSPCGFVVWFYGGEVGIGDEVN